MRRSICSIREENFRLFRASRMKVIVDNPNGEAVINIQIGQRFAESFAEIDPEMQLTTMLVFMYVATRGTCTQKDLEVGMGLSNATASRNVSYWTETKRYQVKGVGYIRREEDPTDRRYKMLTLTEEGQEFYNRIREADHGKAKRFKVAG